jgi:hypothetical protein
MGYLRFPEERLSWKSSHRSIASAANRSFSEVVIFLFFSNGHSATAVYYRPIWNISAGCTSAKVSQRSSAEVLNICGTERIILSNSEMCCLTSDPVGSLDDYPGLFSLTHRRSERMHIFGEVAQNPVLQASPSLSRLTVTDSWGRLPSLSM